MQPTPAISIQDCKMLQQAQRFDVTALIDGMSEARSVNVTRQVVSITIIDDSGNDSKPGQLTFAFFMDLPLSKEDAATMNILQAAQTAEVKPVFSFFLVNAVGSKATRLKQVAESLQVIPQESRVMSLSNLLSKAEIMKTSLVRRPFASSSPILVLPQTSRSSTKSLRSGKPTGLKLDGQWATTCLRRMAADSGSRLHYATSAVRS